MDLKFFRYKEFKDTWFWITSSTVLSALLIIMVLRFLPIDIDEIWKLLLFLIPYVLTIWQSIRVIMLRSEYKKSDSNKTLIFNESERELIIEENLTSVKIKNEDLKSVHLYTSYGNGPPFTDFTYMELILNNNQSYIITSRLAEPEEIYPLIKGKVKRQRAKFMNSLRN